MFNTANLDPEQRAAHCCALPDFDTSQWTASDTRHEHMGAPPDYASESTDSGWQYPPESVEDDGCPGAWYRCEFVRSLLKYRRPMDGNGNRIGHHAYDNAADPFLQECLRVWEGEEMHAESHRLRVIQG